MSDPNTLRILEIDGGGERGYLSNSFLKLFVDLWGVDPTTLYKQFDVICGTSVGGMMALSLAYGLSLDQINTFLTVQGPYIFTLGVTPPNVPPPLIPPIAPSMRPGSIAKVGLLLAGIPFYQSSGPLAAQYGYGLLKATLEAQFGTGTLQDLKTNVIIPTYRQDTSTYTLCSNLGYPDFSAQNELISNVALATGSAPIYLPPLVLSNTTPGTLNGTYIDGGIYQNNPASFGRTLAEMIKPTASRCCVLSIGTGLGEMGFDPGNPDIVDPRVQPMINQLKMNNLGLDSPTDNIALLFKLFDIACTGGQESVAKSLDLESRYALTQLYYYRFQPTLDPNLNTELDNTDPEILAYYDMVAKNVFDEDIENIAAFLGHLTA